MKRMAADAAKRLRELVAAGEEIAYDIREPDSGRPLCEYAPQTERFIRKHVAALRELDSFRSVGNALESSGLAGRYLDLHGVPAPPEPDRRGELATVVFLCRLWADSTDFSLPPERVTRTIDELESVGDAANHELEVVVPLRGFQMAATRLELATVSIVRADTVDVPVEARSAGSSEGAGWEPTFLMVAKVRPTEPGEEGEGAQARALSVEAFRQAITALRLFKEGGVGLGPHGWAWTSGDRWRRIATGAGRPRPGGYRLTEQELGEVMALSRTLANRSTPFGPPGKERPGLAGALARAISRFEVGLERTAVLEGLNDHLLALRFVLEGGGPAALALSVRVAALCAEPDAREETKALVDRALSLERELWSGEPAPTAGASRSPAETAVAIEELTRAILKDAACGHLGADLRATADEILLADGLAVGEGAAEQRGSTSEWESLPESAETGLPQEPDPAEIEEDGDLAPGVEEIDFLWEDDPEPVQVPEPRGRITIAQAPRPEEEKLKAQLSFQAAVKGPSDPDASREEPTSELRAVEPAVESSPSPVERDDEMAEKRPSGRERAGNRVAHLFPRPETCEWDVREIVYDRRRRATAGDRDRS